MNWKKMIVIGALACGAAGLMAGCGESGGSGS